jgi:hypothetical protein
MTARKNSLRTVGHKKAQMVFGVVGAQFIAPACALKIGRNELRPYIGLFLCPLCFFVAITALSGAG